MMFYFFLIFNFFFTGTFLKCKSAMTVASAATHHSKMAYLHFCPSSVQRVLIQSSGTGEMKKSLRTGQGDSLFIE